MKWHETVSYAYRDLTCKVCKNGIIELAMMECFREFRAKISNSHQKPKQKINYFYKTIVQNFCYI